MGKKKKREGINLGTSLLIQLPNLCAIPIFVSFCFVVFFFFWQAKGDRLLL